VLAVRLDGGGQSEQIVLRCNTVMRTVERDTGDDMGALRERSGLVEQHGIDLAHALQRQPVLHEDPNLGGDGGRQRDDERNRQPERVRAGDHEHGDRVLDSSGGIAEEQPRREGDDAGGEGDVEQEGGSSIS
jgi:hypothetical protein